MKSKIFILLIITVSLNSSLIGQDTKIVVMNMYWAKEGKIEEVHQLRLYASEVRKKLGLEVGRVLFNKNTTSISPNVIWECEYPSIEARNRDVELLSKSTQFDEVKEKMNALVIRFERAVYEISNGNN